MVKTKLDIELIFLISVGVLLVIVVFGIQYVLALAGRPDSVWLMEVLGVM